MPQADVELARLVGPQSGNRSQLMQVKPERFRPVAYVAAGALGVTALGGAIPGFHLLPNINFGGLFGHDETFVQAANDELDNLYAPQQIPLIIGHGRGGGSVDMRPHSSFGPLDWIYKETDNRHAAQNISADIQVWIAHSAIKAVAYPLASGSNTRPGQQLGVKVYVNPRGLWTELAKDGTAANGGKTPQAVTGESLVAGIIDGLTDANHSPYDVAAETVAKDAFDNSCGSALTISLIYGAKQWERLELKENAKFLRQIGQTSAAAEVQHLADGPINVAFLPLHKGQPRTSDPWQLIHYMPKGYVKPYPTPELIAPILGDNVSAKYVKVVPSAQCVSASLAVKQQEQMLQQSLPVGVQGVGNVRGS